MIRMGLLALLSMALHAHAQDLRPIVAAEAADLEVLNAKTIRLEAQQRAALSTWYATRNDLKEAEIKLAQAKTHFDRMEQMHASQVITEEQYWFEVYKHTEAQNRYSELKHLCDRDRARAEAAKYDLLAEGNPRQDYRRELTESYIADREAEIRAFQTTAKTVELARDLTKGRMENGQRLRRSDTTSPAEQETRILNYKLQEQELVSIQRKITAREDAVAAFRKVLTRLNTRP